LEDDYLATKNLKFIKTDDIINSKITGHVLKVHLNISTVSNKIKIEKYIIKKVLNYIFMSILDLLSNKYDIIDLGELGIL